MAPPVPALASGVPWSPPAPAAPLLPPTSMLGPPPLLLLPTMGVLELAALPAIGPAIAQRIIDDRTANGPYKQIEDLARVRGISARTVDQLRGRITVGP